MIFDLPLVGWTSIVSSPGHQTKSQGSRGIPFGSFQDQGLELGFPSPTQILRGRADAPGRARTSDGARELHLGVSGGPGGEAARGLPAAPGLHGAGAGPRVGSEGF